MGFTLRELLMFLMDGFFGGSWPRGTVTGLLFIVGEWGLLQKSGLKGWWALEVRFEGLVGADSMRKRIPAGTLCRTGAGRADSQCGGVRKNHSQWSDVLSEW